MVNEALRCVRSINKSSGTAKEETNHLAGHAETKAHDCSGEDRFSNPVELWQKSDQLVRSEKLFNSLTLSP